MSVAVEFAVRAIAPAVAAVVVWAAFVVTILGADGDTAHVPHRAHAPRVPSRRLR